MLGARRPVRAALLFPRFVVRAAYNMYMYLYIYIYVYIYIISIYLVMYICFRYFNNIVVGHTAYTSLILVCVRIDYENAIADSAVTLTLPGDEP